MFIFYNGFILGIIAHMSIFSIIVCPIIAIYLILHLIIKLVINLLFSILYIILKKLNIEKYKLIKDTLFLSSKLNPLHYLYLREKTRHFKNNHVSKQVNVITFNNNFYNGELKYIMDLHYVRIDDTYIKYDIIKEVNLNSMYKDIYNYKITNVRNNFPIYIPNEINDIIESYIYTRKKVNTLKCTKNKEVVTTYILYEGIQYNDYEYEYV